MCKTCTTFSARPSLRNDMDGGVAAALIEEEAEQRACPDLDAHWRLDEAMDRAEKAERERDEWKDSAIKAMADLERAEQPRPLAADDITDAGIERAREVWETAHGCEDVGVTLRRAFVAALTEPTRPEGAEELARLIATADVGEWDCGDLADALLATGRVRVVTEEQP